MIEKTLTKIISDFIPEGRVETTVLPQRDDISLYLLNPDYPEHELSREQGLRLMAEPLFWVFCWASGQAMARYLLDNPQLIKGKRVLDFGCGSGVAAIAASKTGAAKVWACDIDPYAVHATTLNCQFNSVSVDVIEDWEACAEELDIILAADVLYDRKNLTLLDQFTARAPEVLVADSRVKQFNAPFYRKIAELDSFTIPDLGEPAEFGRVNIYHAHQKKESSASIDKFSGPQL
ncbi:50S ribosomal protein L11 methyltransferase [Desulfobacula sp.]|uniref:class I SAM-dependent methyltransferase n=1 Tax=Desulfobacula sp. TaxID=2593537 RepID=UPI00262A1B07|nr:50S ribosomal protein L11 methyltransferase [Desulfobacula sp.]